MTHSGNSLNKPLVSVLLRTKDEEGCIGNTLASLLSQTYNNIELIIVDSGSTDRTLEIARKYPVTIYEISPEDFTYGYSLNYGFRRAKGEYVACLSAHAKPVSHDWIEILVSNFDNNNSIAAVMSHTVPLHDCNPFDRRGLTKKFNIPKQEIFEGEPYIFSNSCSMIRKRVWERIPFDDKLIAVEDHDWAQKVRKKKFKIIYEPAAKVYHSHNETLGQIFNRYYRETYGITVLKMKTYTIAGLLFDFVAGTAYDMAYVIQKRDNIKWLFYGFLRRLIMNYARYKATAAAKKST